MDWSKILLALIAAAAAVLAGGFVFKKISQVFNLGDFTNTI